MIFINVLIISEFSNKLFPIKDIKLISTPNNFFYYKDSEYITLTTIGNTFGTKCKHIDLKFVNELSPLIDTTKDLVILQ